MMSAIGKTSKLEMVIILKRKILQPIRRLRKKNLCKCQEEWPARLIAVRESFINGSEIIINLGMINTQIWFVACQNT